jgi:drug/metabolite transporter (DMT)-like permease
MVRDRLATTSGVVTGIFTALAWAGWIVITRLGVQTSLTPYDITALRFLVAGIVVLPHIFRHPSLFVRVGYLKALVLAVSAGVPYVLMGTFGLSLAPATHAAILVPGAVPLFSVLLNWLILGNRPTKSRMFWLALILLGIFFIGWDSLTVNTLNYLRGDLMFLGAALLYASYTVASRLWMVMPLDAAAIINVISLVLYLPVYIVFISSRFTEAPLRDIVFQAAYHGIITSIIVVVAYTHTIRVIGATKAASFIALVPAIATLLAVPVLNEIPSLPQCVGITATSFGMLGIVLAASKIEFFGNNNR